MQISVRVKTGTKTPTRLEKQADGTFVAFLNARPHDGEANRALITLVSKEFNIPKTSITIARGAKSHQKTLEF